VSSDRHEHGRRRLQVPLADLLVDEELLDAVGKALSSGWWSMGPTVEEFEEKFAAFCRSKHAIAVSSGTAALHLALLAAGCKPDDEVILPSLNFVAAANAIAHCGAHPVFCDIVGPMDLNLDPEDVEQAIGPKTSAILALHYGGFPCDIRAVLNVANRHGLPVIEDTAHAPGASVHGKMCGTFGLAGCFSFFSNKNLAMGEGGMVITDDYEMAARMRLLRSHGMTTLTWARHQGHADSYDVVARGFNYRLDELHAAIGLVQLRRLPEANEARARVDAHYRREIDGVHGVTLPFGSRRSYGRSAHHLAVVVLPRPGLQESMRALLRERGIQTSVHYPPIHTFSAYTKEAQRPLPNTQEIAGRILTLPMFAHMRDDQVALVVDGVLATTASSSGSLIGQRQ
jgi:dTDP-4-amino-4,6-dideoxygalactose transaminase